jgi:hypothetical protein
MQPGTMLFVHPHQDADGGFEVVAECHEQVDVVEIPGAAEAVGEVVSGVDGGEHFVAMVTEEAIASFAAFGGRAVGAEAACRLAYLKTLPRMSFSRLGIRCV